MLFRALARLMDEPEKFSQSAPELPATWRVPDLSLTSVFNLSSLDQIIGQGIPEEGRVRVLYKNGRLAADRFTLGNQRGGSCFANHVNPATISKILDQGGTLTLDRLPQIWAPLGDFCRRLSFELGLNVDASSFLTPAGLWGLDYHYDIASVILLQTSGSKTWRIHPPTLVDPLEQQKCGGIKSLDDFDQKRLREEEPFLQVTLRAGDALFIPRGWYHGGVAEDEHSLHVTLWFPHYTAYSLANMIVRGLDKRDDKFAILRKDVGWGLAHDPQRAKEVVLKSIIDVVEVLDCVDPNEAAEDFLREMRNGFIAPARTHPITSVLVASVDIDTPLVLIPEAIQGISRNKSEIQFDLADSKLTVEGRAAEFLATLWSEDSQNPWCARDLALDLDGASAILLARRLISDGLVKAM
ncbi:cupin domain-containing protein [Streptomyces sp. NPDC006173]|uniref:JmjC domain-containing protein n=1 Tax=Streptomyces sp. NPDC006173 TaxID=3155349 RepID=UPI0033D1E35C